MPPRLPGTMKISLSLKRCARSDLRGVHEGANSTHDCTLGSAVQSWCAQGWLQPQDPSQLSFWRTQMRIIAKTAPL